MSTKKHDESDSASADGGAHVKAISGSGTSAGLALAIDGRTFQLDKQTVVVLKQIVDRAIVGLAL